MVPRVHDTDRMPQRAKPHGWLERPGVCDALASGKSLAQVAALAGVTRQSVGLYKRTYFQPALHTAAKARAFDRMTTNLGVPSDEVEQAGRLANSLIAANPLIERSDMLWKQAWDSVLDAKQAVSTLTDAEGNERIRGRDFAVVAPIIGAAVRTLELFGRASGYLQDDTGQGQVMILAAPGANVTVGTPAIPQSTAVLDISPDDDTGRR
jgi:hypothetical protein